MWCQVDDSSPFVGVGELMFFHSNVLLSHGFFSVNSHVSEKILVWSKRSKGGGAGMSEGVSTHLLRDNSLSRALSLSCSLDSLPGANRSIV